MKAIHGLVAIFIALGAFPVRADWPCQPQELDENEDESAFKDNPASVEFSGTTQVAGKTVNYDVSVDHRITSTSPELAAILQDIRVIFLDLVPAINARVTQLQQSFPREGCGRFVNVSSFTQDVVNGRYAVSLGVDATQWACVLEPWPGHPCPTVSQPLRHCREQVKTKAGSGHVDIAISLSSQIVDGKPKVTAARSVSVNVSPETQFLASIIGGPAWGTQLTNFVEGFVTEAIEKVLPELLSELEALDLPAPEDELPFKPRSTRFFRMAWKGAFRPALGVFRVFETKTDTACLIFQSMPQNK
ncbi:hypothetical protein [Mesorhizobium sp. M0909]|uniref:hypothetical protein n=1 Tax=Mesorhizobium sp. M0909 TaxID=2957024 RepID=UPI0033375D47